MKVGPVVSKLDCQLSGPVSIPGRGWVFKGFDSPGLQRTIGCCFDQPGSKKYWQNVDAVVPANSRKGV